MNTTGNLQMCWLHLLLILSKEADAHDLLVSAGLHGASTVSSPEATLQDPHLAMKIAVAGLANLAGLSSRVRNE